MSRITFVDIDETIFHTFAMIQVMNKDKLIKTLTNQQFNTYKLKNGENFDFTQFQNSEIFYNTSKPIKKMIDKIEKMINEIKCQNNDDRVIFLTARSDFDDKELFLDTFRKNNIDIDDKRVYIERSGNLLYIKTVSERKKKIISDYLKSNKYSETVMYDDDLRNLNEFMVLQKDFPDIKFYPYMVDKYGNTKLL